MLKNVVKICIFLFLFFSGCAHKIERSITFIPINLDHFNTNKVGYAMWNLISSMGIINSERTDCIYEKYRGKQLDREMTTILQSSGN